MKKNDVSRFIRGQYLDNMTGCFDPLLCTLYFSIIDNRIWLCGVISEILVMFLYRK
jgi:hypothetical protein